MQERHWAPDCIDARFTCGSLSILERRVVIEGALASVLELRNSGQTTFEATVVAWLIEDGSRITDRTAARLTGRGLAFRTRGVHAQLREDDSRFDLELDIEPPPVAACCAEAYHSRNFEADPDWSLSPLHDLFLLPPLRSSQRLPTEAPTGRTLAHFGVFLPVRIPPRETQGVTVRLHASQRDAGPGRDTADRTRPKQDDVPPDRESRERWRTYFDAAPVIDCDDAYIRNFFDYRWYGLRLNFIGPAGNYRFPTCAEGTDFFHDAVSYSAWCHARELRWLPDAERARGVIRTFLDHQRPGGSLPGIIYPSGINAEASYFADWGGSVLAVDEVHPDRSFLEAAYRPLSLYAEHLARARDPDRTGLYRVLDPYETGQEIMSRYTIIDPDADALHFDYALDLFGVDITIYTYRLHRALARIAASLGGTTDCRRHDATADRIGDAVRSRMWDPAAGLFFDIDPRTGTHTGIRAAICFYPWLTDIPGPEHAAGLERNLFDPDSFDTPYPVPSTARSDRSFDPDGFWKGVRQNCPWNGRVWPMANSHVADALAIQATTHAPHLRERAGDFIRRFVRMMFFDGDPSRPNSFEHYSPITGRPCTYRGLDDYQHSWINDLVIRWLAGFRPSSAGFVVDPLPGIEHLALDRLPFRGRSVSIAIEGDDIAVEFDGEHRTGRRDEEMEFAVS
jgi:Mannosylglycerate hydrolase MGH1-like glycoside hydrolase domain